MRLMLLLGSVVTLTACQTQDVQQMSYTDQKAWAAGIVQACKAQNVPQAEMSACINAEAKRDAGNRYLNRQRAESFRIALADGMGQMGDNMRANAAANRSITCNSSRYGNSVTTNCY